MVSHVSDGKFFVWILTIGEHVCGAIQAMVY